MDDPVTDLGIGRLLVTSRNSLYLGALRYFDAAGAFVADIESLLRTKLPKVTQASITDASDQSAALLAWRSPTETLVITASAAGFDAISRLCAVTAGGCFVDQSHGHSVLSATGCYVPTLIARLGDANLMPSLGESKRGRLADLPVLALKVHASETLLLVDRAYQAHLVQWIRATALDLHLDKSLPA
jgi:heterotetrameric sarcosine oxidase gamma subunit